MQEQRRQVYSVSGFRAAAAGRGISRELHGTSPRRGDALLRHDLPLRADEDRLSKPLTENEWWNIYFLCSTRCTRSRDRVDGFVA